MILGGAVTAFATRCLLVFYGYKSYKSIETTAWKDDAHWLTFWMLYAFLQWFEFWLDYFMFKFPFYFEAKLVLYVYLGLFAGATKVYEMGGKRAIQTTEGAVEQFSQRKEVQDTLQAVKAQQNRLMQQFSKKE
eukprot:NODE_1405_length_932_cov_679.457531_g1083_i0.p1 GENE.NODE_1405_length_932_cov_679.457531_g1083_i0~~NODE_1405_length_932_cov_679.457531_g1083_i0.p1  ORF type:complete len:153 (-),score=45.58 NODE_1405_length_932_cov_679.457531_g1083_i0:474-872(-)